MISEVQEFEKTQGFSKTNNFRKTMPAGHFYVYCYSAGLLNLPNSYDGLRPERATETGCHADATKRDVFFYRPEAVPGGSKITSALVEATDERKVVVVAHEDFHSIMGSAPASINEAATALVGFVTAAEFAKAQFGEESELYRHLSHETDLFLTKANLIRSYYARLRLLYASARDGRISTAAALVEKQRVFDELGRSCKEISPAPSSFNSCPLILNNAGLAFDMTYTDYYPAVYQLYVENNRDLKVTIAALKEVARGKRRLEHVLPE
jgi:hypothetical protein